MLALLFGVTDNEHSLVEFNNGTEQVQAAMS